MYAHLENENIATVAQSKQHIIPNCNVFDVLSPKYATMPLFLLEYTAHLNIGKKLEQKRKKLFLGWQIIKKYTFSALGRSKTFKNAFYTHDFNFRKQYGDKTKSSKQIMKFSTFRSPGTVEISCFQKENPRERCHFTLECTYSVRQMYFTSSVKI